MTLVNRDNNKESFKYSVNQLSKQQIQKYKMMFNIIDQDHDEYITVKDLKTTMVSVGLDSVSDDEIQKMIPESNEGKLNFNTFLKIVAAKFSGFSEESELKDAFTVFQTKEDDLNSVDAKELSEILVGFANDDSEELNVPSGDIQKTIVEFVKENKITGEKKFLAENFIDIIKQ